MTCRIQYICVQRGKLVLSDPCPYVHCLLLSVLLLLSNFHAVPVSHDTSDASFFPDKSICIHEKYIILWLDCKSSWISSRGTLQGLIVPCLSPRLLRLPHKNNANIFQTSDGGHFHLKVKSIWEASFIKEWLMPMFLLWSSGQCQRLFRSNLCKRSYHIMFLGKIILFK